MKSLYKYQQRGHPIRLAREGAREASSRAERSDGLGEGGPTSVSIAKSGFHESGGMTLQMPYFLASGVILRMYSTGSFHSSSVGWYTGASSSSYMRLVFLTGSFTAVGWPRRSTDERSSGRLIMLLNGCWGCTVLPFWVAGGVFVLEL